VRKLLSLIFLLLLPAVSLAAPTCPTSITTIGGEISCWVPPSSGTTIADLVDSNPLTIDPSSTFGLQAGNTLGCGNGGSAQPQNVSSGCDLTSTASYSPSALTLVMKFSGLGGPLAQFGSTSATTAPYQYFELYLDTFGRLTWGTYNYGALNTLQTGTKDRPQVYADGNSHIAVASIGANGMRLYVDGSLVGNNSLTLANYAAGYWLFGNASLTGAAPSGASWPYATPQPWFNGTLYYWAWWNSQLTDAQAEALSNPGTNPPGPITNNYCTVTGQMGSLYLTQGYAFANSDVTFNIEAGQLPACSATIPVAASQQTYTTDAQGNLPPNLTIPQGAHVNMLWAGTTTPLIIPCQSNCPISELIPAQNPLPDAVSAIDLAGPLYQGTTVSNPAVGTIGPATLTAPGTAPYVGSGSTVTLDRNLGPQFTVTLTATSSITFSDLEDGAPPFAVDVIEGGSGGYTSPFVAPAGYTLAWPGGSQPSPVSTAIGVHSFYSFTVEGTKIFGSLAVSTAGTGTFPLTATANFNNYSGVNINSLTTGTYTGPTPTVSATCTGTCATTYTYELTCLGDNSTYSPVSTATTAMNASTLDGTHFNTITWTDETGCSGYNIYGRIGGSLGLIATVGAAVATFTDNTASSPGAAPPTSGTMGVFTATGGFIGNLNVLTTLGDTLYENATPANARLAGNASQLATPTAPVITNVGTAGSTYYPYYLVCNDSVGGQTLPSLAGTTTTGNATLSASNYNVVTFPTELGCASFDVLSPDTVHSVALAVTAGFFDDIGGGGTSYVTPVANTTQTTKFLSSTDTGGAVQAPAWSLLGAINVPGFDNVTVRGIPTANMVPLTSSATAAVWTNLSSITPHGQQLIITTGTFTVPANVYSVTFEVWGPGGGGGGYGATPTNGSNGSAATTVKISSTTYASGTLGEGGASATASAIGAGGTISGSSVGTLALAGNPGFYGNVQSGASRPTGGTGGMAPRGDASSGAVGCGGNGGGNGVGVYGGGGGGSGGYGETQVTTTPATVFAVVVGVGGAGGTGGTEAGANGCNGAVLATW